MSLIEKTAIISVMRPSRRLICGSKGLAQLVARHRESHYGQESVRESRVTYFSVDAIFIRNTRHIDLRHDDIPSAPYS